MAVRWHACGDSFNATHNGGVVTMPRGWRFRWRWGACHRHAGARMARSVSKKRAKKIVLVGSPNVGKSVIFNNLTGTYATVSNYPGTTVEIFRGYTVINGQPFEVVDTPGMYSMRPVTDEERVTRRILLEESPDVVLQIVDAKNLERALLLTLQLLEAGLRLILVLNMMDEAKRLGIEIDVEALSRMLQMPVVTTIGPRGIGMAQLREAISRVTSDGAQSSDL